MCSTQKFKRPAGIIAGKKFGHRPIVQENKRRAGEDRDDDLGSTSGLDDAYASRVGMADPLPPSRIRS